jgi:hypothetical protein
MPGQPDTPGTDSAKSFRPAPRRSPQAAFPRIGTALVYYRAMRLFRRRASKKQGKAEVQLLEQQTSAEAAAVPQRRLAEARPDPDQPGWGRTIGQAISKAREESSSQK